MTLKKALGAMIRARRKEVGMTQEALSAATGISRPYISLSENGHFSPSVDTLALLAKGLGVPASTLLLAVEKKMLLENILESTT